MKLDGEFTSELALFQRMDQVLASIEERLDSLQGKAHGGIKIYIAGALASVEISPTGAVNGNEPE